MIAGVNTGMNDTSETCIMHFSETLAKLNNDSRKTVSTSMKQVLFLVAGVFVACSSSQGLSPSSDESQTLPFNDQYGAKPERDRCTELCKRFDETGLGTTALSCGTPKMFEQSTGRYRCEDLCKSVSNGDGCLQAIGAVGQCMYDCPSGGECSGFSRVTCEKAATCGAAELDAKCDFSYKRFIETQGIDLGDGGVSRPIAQVCTDVCQKRESSGCPIQQCETGCPFYASFPQACQDALRAESECLLAASNICSHGCADLVLRRVDICK